MPPPTLPTEDGIHGPIPIGGIPVDNERQPPMRMEFRKMKEDKPKMWELYILGLDRLMGTKEDLPLSYFQIAGIHGLPYGQWPANTTWNKMEAAKGQSKNGFCTHTSILFLPWHRPYLSLFETELYKHVNFIASKYEDSEDGESYRNAAKDFRMPYWDWALPTEKGFTLFPSELHEDYHHDVKWPRALGGSPIDTNPLAFYTFGEKGTTNDEIKRFGGRTIRHPIPGIEKPDEDELIEQLKAFRDLPTGERPGSKGKNLTERVLFILKSYNSFAGMSHNQWYKGNKFEFFGSLEDIHNSLHGYIGGNGHMGEIKLSAFDPVFYLHHTNIDRLFAIWQAIHDQDPETLDSYVTKKQNNKYGTYTTEKGAWEDEKSPLTPFYAPDYASEKTHGFWNSKGVRTTKEFGYVYPETQDWVFKNRGEIKDEVDRLYKTGSLPSMVKNTGKTLPAATQILEQRAQSNLLVAETPVNTVTLIKAAQDPSSDAAETVKSEAAKVHLPSNRSLEDLVKDGKYLEWLVDIKAEKHALRGNFVVHVFLGEPEDANPYLYVANQSHVGNFTTLGQDTDTGCERCQVGQAEGIEVTGQIPLTIALIERYLSGQLADLSVDKVIEYLQTNLHWRVTNRDGQRISRVDVNKLLVGVVTNEVTLPDPSEPNEWPSYAPYVVPRPEATTKTNGREGRGRGTGYTGGDIINA